MGLSSRKSKTSSSRHNGKGHTLEKQLEAEPNRPVKIKSKSKSKMSNKWLWIGCLLVVLGIGFALLGDKIHISSVWSGRRKYEFDPRPVPDFDIRRGIERRSNLSLEEFTELYDAKWPVLVTDAMQNWAALKKWTKQFFITNYGAEVVSFKGTSGKLHQSQGLAAPIGLFLQHLHESAPNQWSYADDEVFLVRNPELKKDIDTPIYLKEDFFSLLPQDIRPWNAMLLWGTRYSRSTLHIDPYNWTGTNAVLRGRKAWKLFPPGQDHLLYVPSGRSSGFPLDCPKYQSQIDTFDYDPKKFPLFKKAKYIEFDQLPGEMLFIPTGWFHQAYNREETLAISSQVWNTQNYR